jgi:NAD(P)H dehydrogenase (quinone)
MATIAIVYHSTSGHTKKLAEAVERGARAAGASVTLIPVEDLGADAPAWATLDAADAIIFGAPTYMGGYSSHFKAFAEAASGRWFQQKWKDKFAAGFTTSGSYSGDKLNTLQGLAINAAQHGMIWISLGLLPPLIDNEKGPAPDAANRSGAFLGAMGSSFMAPPEVSPSTGDVKTGELLGERVATLTAKFLGR